MTELTRTSLLVLVLVAMLPLSCHGAIIKGTPNRDSDDPYKLGPGGDIITSKLIWSLIKTQAIVTPFLEHVS